MHVHRFTVREGTRGVRTFLTAYRHENGPQVANARFEGYVASGAKHTGLRLRTDEDSQGLQLFTGVAHIANAWISVGTPRLGAWLYEHLPHHDTDIAEVTFHGRAVWWSFWCDTWSWSSKTPRWRKGSFHWWDWFTGKPAHDEEVLEGPIEVLVPMPEGSYRANVKLTRSTWKRPRWPWPKIHHGYDIDVLSRPSVDGPYFPELDEDGNRPSGYIPTPGKGENAWDCGPDGIFAMSGPGRTIEAAISDVIECALRDRRRRGHSHTYAEPIS